MFSEDTASPRETLTEIFGTDTPYDTPEQAADLFLAVLAAKGYAFVPRHATKQMIRAWRVARAKSVGPNDLANGPGFLWRVMVDEAGR